MKIDGEARRERATADAVALAQTASAQAMVESFRATLQRHRRPDRDDSKSRPGARETGRGTVRATDRTSDRTTGRASDRDTDGAALSAPGYEEMREAPAGVAANGASHLRFLPRPVNADLPEPAPLAEFHAALRSRRAGGSSPASCIEVVHERTGTRFVLSREGDSWLLAIKSENAPHPAELASIVAMLNAQFEARGLGPVDIILG
jgi:hypothetical protein